MRSSAGMLLVCSAIWACESRSPSLGLIYLDGRAVEPVGDSILAMTAEGVDGLLLYHLDSPAIDTLGRNVLTSPLHIQAVNGRWYVSDLVATVPAITVLAWDGTIERRIDLSDISSIAHQFAVLPDGQIVVESRDGQLVALAADSVTTFALIEVGMRPSLLAAAAGGVLHAVPGEHITLYNGFGHIRWRVEWPWAETAFITDMAIDRQSRIHFIAGVPSDGTFIVYTMGREDGEVIRWSQPGPYATFIVRRNGSFRPDSVSNWLN